ncbi:MAG: E2 ligase fold family C protein [Gemmatimonadaceae bacterium]|nr:E2 ligase fold family C protein [Gemmatimonadaceae bacterium]
MGLAPFFDKTALAAAAVLQGFNRERFRVALEAQPIALAFDDAATQSTEGRITLTLAVNLAARLYPTLGLIARGPNAAAMRPKLEAIARAVNPNIALEATIPVTSGKIEGEAVVLIVGDSVARTFGVASTITTVYIGSYGWEARVSTAHPVGSGMTILPFGAAAAACLGAANVFRHVFRAQLPNAGLDHALSVSTLSFATRLDDAANSAHLDDDVLVDLDGTDLGEAVLVGAGAVGQGALWTLARVPGLRGTLHVVDGEAVDPSNPQRYVLAASADVGASKAALAGELMQSLPEPVSLDGSLASHPLTAAGPLLRSVPSAERSALTIVPHVARWGQFLAARPTPWRLPRVLVALDSAGDRIAVQGALPRWIANAWTQPGDLGLSWHPQFGRTACLACLYLPSSASVANEDMLVAEAVGLRAQHMLVRHLLATGAPVDDAVIAQIAAGLGIPVEPLLPFCGRPLRAFYTEAVCGGVVLRLQSEQPQSDAHQQGDGDTPSVGQPRDRAAMVPMAFQSVLAGVLLAAAAVAETMEIPARAEGQKAVLDLLRPIAARLLVPVARHGSGKCLCHDSDYRAASDTQWAPRTAQDVKAVDPISVQSIQLMSSEITKHDMEALAR